MRYYHHHGPFDPWGGPPGGYPPLAHMLTGVLFELFWIGLLAAVIWAAVAAARLPYRRALAPVEQPSALELLRRSYILGHIDVETFGEMLVPILELEEFAKYDRLSPPTAL